MMRSVLIGGVLVGAGIQFLQIRLTAWFVNRKGSKIAAFVMVLKALLWIGLFAGTLSFSPKVTVASVAGCTLYILGYAIAHFITVRREE